ncbi:MAG: glycosyl hydrolase family 18 protein [Defluviitaleaceae bacterium]|nr:glycosyl hydrolase family 18 protein [Defluviitaleaceae bacterium]
MIIVAYIAEEKFSNLRAGDMERLTHANFAFALVVDGKGSVVHWKNQSAVRNFIKNKGSIKAMLAVGGWAAGGFSPAVATVESREMFAQSLVDIVHDFGFDGIDMDWEYPCDDIAGIEASSEDKPNYTLFIQLLREKLGGDKLITMAAGGSQQCADNLQMPKLIKLMDYINIMTYDLCPWDYVSYHPSLYPSNITKNIAGADVIDIYEKAGVPRNKLVIGAAFYGRIYKNVDGLNAKGGVPEFTEGYDDSAGIAKAAGGTSYDKKAEAIYAYNTEDRTFITFESPQTLTAKMNYAKSTGLAGIMFWEYHHDTQDSILLKTIYNNRG